MRDMQLRATDMQIPSTGTSPRQAHTGCLACGESHFDGEQSFVSALDRRLDLTSWLAEELGEIPTLTFRECKGCRTVSQLPLGSQAMYTRWYQNPRYDFTRGLGYADPVSEGPRHALLALGILSRHVSGGSRQLLDVGCGPGHFLRIASRRGWTALGVDPAEHRLPLGLNAVERRAFEEFSAGDRRFDVVSFLDVFEHFINPSAVLDKVTNILSDRGLLLLEVPNVRSLYARALTTRWWFGFEHLFYYSAAGLSALLESCGFEVLEITTPDLNLLSLEGLFRFRLFGEEEVWGRQYGNSHHGWPELKTLLRAGSRPLNYFPNALGARLLLGDQLFAVARKRPTPLSASPDERAVKRELVSAQL